MRIATSAYPIDWHADWASYAAKKREWVSSAAGNGAELLAFPEYGAMELASLAGETAAADRMGASEAVSNRMGDANALDAELAAEFGVHILGSSAPIVTGETIVNRAHLFAPTGAQGHQDKQIMTRFERSPWEVSGGCPLQMFDTTIGKIGVLICYDSEFPLLGRTLVEAGCEIILVPSCTEALEGYWRVRIGAMARALEGQCISVMSSLISSEPRLYAVEEATGMGGIFGPPDQGFSPTGVEAEGTLGQTGWTYADIDLAKIAHVRADGNVLNATHWGEQAPRAHDVTHVSLR